jgi:hypothetical protein
LPSFRFVGHTLLLVAVCTSVAAAAIGDDPTPDLPTNFLEALSDLPVMPHFGDLTAPRVPLHADCSVEPLPEIVDPEALQFEHDESLDTAGLLPEMSEALDKFRKLVASVGGTFELRSAYRPPAYQEHLQAVWFKWMRELRRNTQRGCQALREQISDEFKRHKLMETQMPVTSSDHTRGMAFDATVMMPRVVQTKSKKRPIRVSLDHLALLAGLRRPDVRHDPVHFKLVITTPVHAGGL